MTSSPPPAEAPAQQPVRYARWVFGFGVVAGLLIARNLIGLDSAPVGSYVDETSIGYNAWSVATTGLDEHGAHLPLYFTAFGEYKNPVYVYTLALLLKVAPLTVAIERLPAALFGLATCLFLTLLAWQRSRSRPITLSVLVVCVLTPWLTIESRVGFEVVSMLATTSCALWCLSVAIPRGSWRWYLAAGIALAFSVYAYSTGRVAVALFAVALVVGLGSAGRLGRGWLAALPPIVASYALLAWWNFAHPGALTARFGLISIASYPTPAGFPLVVWRFIVNYLTYFAPPFLFVSGDSNSRHATGLGGMLLWVMLPLLIAGAVAMWQRRQRPYIRVLALLTLTAPVAAALTNESVPHSLRASVMLPMLVAVAIEGLTFLCARFTRLIVLRVVVAMAMVQGVLFTADMYGSWPTRSAIGFDAGEIDAIVRAHAMSPALPVLLSQSLDPPYIDAAFALRPLPPSRFTADSQTPLLAKMDMQLVDGAEVTGPPGSLVVLSVFDPAPANSEVVFTESAPAPSFWFFTKPVQYESVVVYRLQ